MAHDKRVPSHPSYVGARLNGMHRKYHLQRNRSPRKSTLWTNRECHRKFIPEFIYGSGRDDFRHAYVQDSS